MKTKIIRIGNSQGIRIPKILLEQCRFGTEVELEVECERILLGPAAHPREGWGEKFRLMSENGDDQMIEDLNEQKEYG
jgi:antitoxin MazE